MQFRQIDARGIWWGESKSLDTFANAYAIDCGACDDTWHRVYGWTQAALDEAKLRAFGPMLSDPADSLCW